MDGSSLIIGADDDKTVLEPTRWPQLSTGEHALSAVLAVVVLSMAGYVAGTVTELPTFLLCILGQDAAETGQSRDPPNTNDGITRRQRQVASNRRSWGQFKRRDLRAFLRTGGRAPVLHGTGETVTADRRRNGARGRRALDRPVAPPAVRHCGVA